jgi:glycosyltransferase involved in cell wall biosynthesis
LICNSQWVKDVAGRPDAEVIHPPALNLRVFQPVQRKTTADLAVGIIGRPEPTKGYDVFLEAAKLVRATRPFNIVVVSPKGSEVPLPQTAAAASFRAENEHDMAEFYSHCDIFVLPSRREGFALPPLEAMACGCAVVIADCGGVSDYAKHETNCLLVPADDPPALASAISRLIEAPELRARLAANGPATAQQFAPRKGLQRFLELVLSTVKKNRAVS